MYFPKMYRADMVECITIYAPNKHMRKTVSLEEKQVSTLLIYVAPLAYMALFREQTIGEGPSSEDLWLDEEITEGGEQDLTRKRRT